MTTSNLDYASPNFIHPDFAPYVPVLRTGRGSDGSPRPYKAYPNHQVGTGFANMDPSVLRMGRGRSFFLKYGNDPCPPGWVKDPSRGGVCIEAPTYTGTFYTSDSLPFSGGNPLGPSALPTPARDGRPQRSAPGDVRVANHLGGYDVTYESKPHRARTKAYVSDLGVLDESHYANHLAGSGYAPLPSREVLL